MSTDDTTTSSSARAHPLGHREERQGGPTLVVERTFRAPVEDVWAAVTEPERLARWIGTWTGDPASGQVLFRMTAEGEDIQADPVTVHECEPPRRLVLSWMSGAPPGELWEVELDLAGAAGVTTLTFGQRVRDAATARDVGPGWEYYLDRLVVTMQGGDVAAVAWPDYEGLGGHYEQLFADPR